MHIWVYELNMPWEKVPAFLKSHPCRKTLENNHFRVPTVVSTGYHKLGNVTKDALIEKDGYMTNKRGKAVSTGFHELGKVGGAAAKDVLVEKDGYMTNKRGKEVSTGFHELGSLGGAAHALIFAATALGEHHTHICISAVCRRGASVSWQKGFRVYVYWCYDFELSGVEGQTPKQQRGMRTRMCKKCHRLAKHCAGRDQCRVTCNTTSRKSCQHLH